MTEPLTADDLARMREEHTPYPNLFEGQHGETGECSGCNGVWPCDAVRLCDEVERLRGPKLTPDEEWEIARAKWQQDLYKRAGQMMARAGQSEAPTVSDGGKD